MTNYLLTLFVSIIVKELELMENKLAKTIQSKFVFMFNFSML